MLHREYELKQLKVLRPQCWYSPVQEQSDKQYFRKDAGEELIGAPDAKKFAEMAAFRLSNRISGQTVVPQADPNIANESRGAQLASTSEPTQPRVEVRQQPSSGVTVTSFRTELQSKAVCPPKKLTLN